MAMYLDVQMPQKIEGESRSTPQHKDWDKKIEIQQMSFNISQTSSQQTGSGLVSSGATVSHISISKTMDKSTPLLFGHLAAGAPIELMYIRVSRPGKAKESATDDGLYEAETYEIRNVIVSSYHTSGAEGPGGMPMEDWSFSFTWIKESFQTTDDKGALKKPGVSVAGFDFGKSIAN